MFEIGAFVVYGSGGVFRIDDIRDEKFGSEVRRYYVMRGILGGSTTVFVPVDSEQLVSRMKPMASREEITSLIDGMPQSTLEWQENTKARAEVFRKIIDGGDRAELLCLMRTIYLKKTELAKIGKRVYAADENAMKKAERMIFDEFSVVLGIDEGGIIKMIEEAEGKTA